MKTKRTLLMAAAAATVLAGAVGCGCSPGNSSGASSSGSSSSSSSSTGTLSGSVSMDGSSTVSPIMEAVAEEFGKENSGVKPTVATSGTGGGFKKFSAGEIDIANASRPIKQEEIDAAKANGVDFVELPIAYDGLTVVVNPANSFAGTLTVAELKKIWEPNSPVKTWADVRAGFPAEQIKLYGAGTDSGTFDYFTKEIVGKEKSSRSDYQASEDDNVLVQGVSGDRFSLGYFGYSYYKENKDKLKAVAIDNGTGAVAPSPETIIGGTYLPLSRPLFLYVNKKALDEKPAVAGIIEYLLTSSGRALITEVGYVPLPDNVYELVLERLRSKKTGSVFSDASTGVKIEDILKK